MINTLMPRQNGRHLPDDILKCIFWNEKIWMLIKISLKFINRGPIGNIPALVQIMAWRRPGDKPLSEPMLISLLTHICVTRPRWVKLLCTLKYTCCIFAFKNVNISHLMNINHIYAHMKFRVFASRKNHFLLTTKMNLYQDIKVNGMVWYTTIPFPLHTEKCNCYQRYMVFKCSSWISEEPVDDNVSLI